MEEDEEYDELDELIDGEINKELNKLITDQIGQYTCQFFKRASENEATPFASGVLVELGGSCYILTASHVIEDWSDKNPLFIRYQEAYISVVGKGVGTEIDKENKLDVACIKLKPELTLILKRWYWFLPIKKFLKHNKLLDSADYCVFGYPVANRRKENGKITSKTFGSAYFVKPSYDRVFEHYGFDPLSHYVLDFIGKAKNIATGKIEKIKIDHYGLSGCGLWYTTIDHDGEKFISEARLIGIMTEFKKDKFNCLIGNRIEVLLAQIQKHEGFKYREKTKG